jgi:hypothetical protein
MVGLIVLGMRTPQKQARPHQTVGVGVGVVPDVDRVGPRSLNSDDDDGFAVLACCVAAILASTPVVVPVLSSSSSSSSSWTRSMVLSPDALVLGFRPHVSATMASSSGRWQVCACGGSSCGFDD